MKRLNLLLVSLLAFNAGVIAQEAHDHSKHDQPAAKTAANPNASEISFEKDVHDFGTIKFGGNGVYEFKFTNTGKEPLIISNAQGSCGCTVPTWPKEPIKANESGKIKVSYDTKRPGPFTKTVTITSNAKSSPKILTIKGVVEEAPKEQTTPFKNEGGSAAPYEKVNN
jgi:hypothetical protein